MKNKELKNNLKFGLVAFIAAALLLSSCQKSETQQQQESSQLSMDHENGDANTNTNTNTNTRSVLSQEEILAILDETDENLDTEQKQLLNSEERSLLKEILEIHPEYTAKSTTELIIGLRENKDYFTNYVLPELEQKLAERNELMAKGELSVTTGVKKISESDVNGKGVLDYTKEENMDRFEIRFTDGKAYLVRCNDKTIKSFNYSFVLHTKDNGELEYCPFAGIEAFAFYNCIYLEEVNSEFVTEIGGSAFLNCKELESITVSEVVNRIAENALQNCRKLINFNGKNVIFIPSSIFAKKSSGVEGGAYANCKSVEIVHLDFPKNFTSLSQYKTALNKINPSAFKGCKIKYVSYTVSATDPDDKIGLGSAISKYFSFGDDVNVVPVVAK